jgi:hypothetical protein
VPIIALMMEAVRTSETSVNFNVTTRRYIAEDSKLHRFKYFIPYGSNVSSYSRITTGELFIQKNLLPLNFVHNPRRRGVSITGVVMLESKL